MTEQRRHLTILFTDIASSSYLARRMEPEEYSSLLSDIRYQLTEKIKAHGGSILRIDGDGVLCVFGYPTVKENAVYEAVKAALEMHTSIDEMQISHPLADGNLKLKTAIHSGVVLTIPGDVEVGRLEIIGEPTNFTAHLCDYAAPGEILVTEEALGRFSNYFEIPQKRTVKLKGRQTPVKIYKISSLNTDQYVSDKKNNGSSFFGRKKALKDLDNFIKQPSLTPQLMFLQGTAGLGKSRLIRELSTRLQSENILVFDSNCEAFLGVKALQPVVDITNNLENSKIKNASLLHSAPEQSLHDYIKTFQATENQFNDSPRSLDTLIENISLQLAKRKEKVIVLIIDDWQWVDNSSRAVIGGLLKKGPKSLKIILSSRRLDPVFSSMHNGLTVQLPPLEKKTLSAIIKVFVPHIEPFTQHRIEEYSGGNPLFLEELCHAVKDSRFNFENYRPQSWMNSLIMERFSQLPKDQMDIVNLAAVIGLNIPMRLLRSVNGGDLKLETLKALESSDFLFPETNDHLRFKHRITREAIYQLIGYEKRKGLHKRVVHAILKNANAKSEELPHDLLAYHYGKSGNAKKSIQHSTIAGDIALKSSFLDKAQAHFKNAIELSEQSNWSFRERLPLAMKYGLSSVVDPSSDRTDMFVNLSKEAHMIEDTKAIAWSEYWLGNHFYGLGQPNRSVRHFRLSYEAAKKIKHGKLETQLIASLGQGYASACHYQTALKYLDKAIRIKRDSRSGSQGSGGLAYALSSKGYVLGEQGHYVQAETCFNEAVNVLQGDKPYVLTSILAQRACSNLWNGFFEEAQTYISAGTDLSKTVHSKYNYSQCMFMNALILYKSTQEEVYIEKMIEATNWLWHDGIGQNLSLNFANLAEIFAHKKDWPNTKKYAVLALQRSRNGDKMCESQAYCALASAAQAQQTRRDTSYYLERAFTSAKLRGSVRELENTRRFQQALALTNH